VQHQDCCTCTAVSGQLCHTVGSNAAYHQDQGLRGVPSLKTLCFIALITATAATSTYYCCYQEQHHSAVAADVAAAVTAIAIDKL
jgi:hypothetical protein